MKKTKILIPILSIAGIATTAAPLVTLASCGNSEKDINLTVNKKEHCNSYTTEGTVKTRRAFTVILSFDNGYKLDSTKTKVTCGSKTLTIENDYKIININTISFISDKVTDSNLVIDAYSTPAMKSSSAEWVETGTTGVIQGLGLWIAVGEKITKDAIKVTVTKGDDVEYPIEIGTGEGQARIKYGWYTEQIDITESFVTNGLSITEDMLEEDPTSHLKEITQIPLHFSITMDGKSQSDTMLAYACKKTTTITINGPEEPYQKGNTYTFEATVGVAEFEGVTWSITSGSECAEIDPDSGILTAINPGSVTFRATSKYDTAVYADKTITIN